MEKTRLVFKPSIARRLLKNDYKVVDIKPQKQQDGSVDYTRVIFVFEYKDGIDAIINEMKSYKSTHRK